MVFFICYNHYSIVLDSDGLKAPPVDKMALLAKDLNRKLTLNHPLPNPINVINQNNAKNSLCPNHNNEELHPHPLQVRKRKIFKTVKEENRLDLLKIKTASMNNNRKNSFINKVEIMYNDKGENFSKLKIMNQPFCGSFSVNSNVYDYSETNSSKTFQNNSTIDLPISLEQSTIPVKHIHSYTKKRFTSDIKLPYIVPHK